ncbi:hypothetical protein HDU86_003954 [Geranomyces michiganensis]|nr:hypothetical protein HDU86_003954 [Geranomyces michiganensis]
MDGSRRWNNTGSWSGGPGSGSGGAGWWGNRTQADIEAMEKLHPSILTNEQQLFAELAISSFGCLVMLVNTIWAVAVIKKRPNRFNASLLFSATTFFLAQAVLIGQSIASGDKSRWYLARLAEQPSSGRYRMQWDVDLKQRLLNLQRAYSACYALATLSYLLLVQFRFRVLKSIMPYRTLWDYVFAGVTTALWAVTMLGYNCVFFNGATSTTGLMATFWNLYLLVMDQTLAAVFLWKLSDFQKSLATASTKDIASKAKGKRNVIIALVGLGIISWCCLAVFVASHYGFPDDEGMQTIMFRVAAAFSSFTVTAALAFVYGVKQMMTRTLSSNPRSRSSRNAGPTTTIGGGRHKRGGGGGGGGGGHDPTSSTSDFFADVKEDGDATSNIHLSSVNKSNSNSNVSNLPLASSPATSKSYMSAAEDDRSSGLEASRVYPERERRPRAMSAAMNPYGVPLQVLEKHGSKRYSDLRDTEEQQWYSALDDLPIYAQPAPPPPPPPPQQRAPRKQPSQRYSAIDGPQGPPRVEFAPTFQYPHMME